MAGGLDLYYIDRDGWTIRSADHSRAAHIEHTIAITGTGPRILTASVFPAGNGQAHPEPDHHQAAGAADHRQPPR